ncbi:MAG: hypothetical protein JSV22_10470 [Bacteroidales bacterium]|nr:MAG: hypothetical protein JSV22_10470 [Bacteroidales bacterium]
MKKLFLAFIIVLCTKISIGQDGGNYIFNSKSDLKQSLFLGPELKISRLIEGYQVYTGFKGAVLFNERIAFGLSAGGFVTETVFESYEDPGETALLNTIMGYGGFYFDYIIHTRSPFQISFPMVLGGSGVMLFRPEETAGVNTNDRLIEGGVFIIYEPGINLEVDITSFLRMGLGIGYRLAFRGDMDRVSPGDLSDLTINWNLKFGSF